MAHHQPKLNMAKIINNIYSPHCQSQNCAQGSLQTLKITETQLKLKHPTSKTNTKILDWHHYQSTTTKAHLKSTAVIILLNRQSQSQAASLGRILQSQGVTTKKALSLVPTRQVSITEGTLRKHTSSDLKDCAEIHKEIHLGPRPYRTI